MLDLDPRRTALVLIDLQRGIFGLPLSPHSGDEVLGRSMALAGRCRAAGAAIVLVHVEWSKDEGDLLRQPVDRPSTLPVGGRPEGWSDFAEGLAQPQDLVITKRQWGAFYGTDLDLQLRRRGIRSIILAGVATNFGVESTARQAWEMGYELVIVEDACTTHSRELHDLAVLSIFPRIARVRKTDDIHFPSA